MEETNFTVLEEAGNKTTVSVGLPGVILDVIDKDRGDVARSKYLRKLIIETITKKLNTESTLKAS